MRDRAFAFVLVDSSVYVTNIIQGIEFQMLPKLVCSEETTCKWRAGIPWSVKYRMNDNLFPVIVIPISRIATPNNNNDKKKTPMLEVAFQSASLYISLRLHGVNLN